MASVGTGSKIALGYMGSTAFLIVGEMHASFGNFCWSIMARQNSRVASNNPNALASQRTGVEQVQASLYIATLAGLAGVVVHSRLSGTSRGIAVAVASVEQQEPRRLLQSSIIIAPAVLAGFYTIFSEPQKIEAAVGFIASISPKELLDSGTEPIEILRMVFNQGPIALIILICVLTSWITVKNRSARLVLIAGPIVVFLGFFTR